MRWQELRESENIDNRTDYGYFNTTEGMCSVSLEGVVMIPSRTTDTAAAFDSPMLLVSVLLIYLFQKVFRYGRKRSKH